MKAKEYYAKYLATPSKGADDTVEKAVLDLYVALLKETGEIISQRKSVKKNLPSLSTVLSVYREQNDKWNAIRKLCKVPVMRRDAMLLAIYVKCPMHLRSFLSAQFPSVHFSEDALGADATRAAMAEKDLVPSEFAAEEKPDSSKGYGR